MVSIPAGSSLGRYVIVEQLGRGGMATVFRCHDPNLDRHVAVKVLPSYYTDDPSFIGRFTQEAQTIARVTHPNILQIYDFGEDKGFTYIVSELVEGGDLQDRLGQDPMSLDEVLKFMRPLSEALDHAHGLGIVHRDLKPANVLIDTDLRPILADFGLARMMESATRFTQESQALGTPEYMAPEQAMGADADHRSDLYAFAIMTYQMLLGETPFRADTPAATLMAHVHKPLPLPTAINPDMDPKIESTLLKALAKTPDDRFQSAKNFVNALELAGGLASPRQMSDDMGATAVLDTVGDGAGDTQSTLAMEDVTSIMEPGAPPTMAPGTQAPSTPGPRTAAPAKPETLDGAPTATAPSSRRMLYIGGGIAAAVVVVVGVGVMMAGGSGDATESATAPPAAASATPDGSDSQPAPEPTAPPAPVLTPGEILEKLNGAIDNAKTNVPALRGIDTGQEVATEFKSLSTLADITRGFFRRDYLRQQVFEAEQLYKTLGLMEESQDLEDILYEIQLQTVRALFDEDTEKVYILSDVTDVGPLEELSIANAYMGGIQQNLFDVADLRKRAREAGSDQFRAINALIQGDVAQVSEGYITTQFSKADVDELTQPLPDNKLLQAPTIIQKTVLFPQREGANFVAEVFGLRNGWEGVGEAYKDPPVSTEQILHPEKYLDGEKPSIATAPDVSSRLGRGWAQVSTDSMGEFIIRTYLEEHLGEPDAAAAASGWAGDGYSLLNGPEGQRLLLSVIRWDTLEDSKEFFDAYQVFVGIRMQGKGVTSERLGDNGRKWVTEDETIFVGQTGPGTVLIVGDDEDIVGQSLDLLFESLQVSTP